MKKIIKTILWIIFAIILIRILFIEVNGMLLIGWIGGAIMIGIIIWGIVEHYNKK